jgi:hypothetical protein
MTEAGVVISTRLLTYSVTKVSIYGPKSSIGGKLVLLKKHGACADHCIRKAFTRLDTVYQQVAVHPFNAGHDTILPSPP